MEFARHVLQRTVVLPDRRILFVPVPKAGCTTILWQLAALAGLDADTFADSAMPEVSTALTVHDMSRWPPEHRLATYTAAETERVLGEEGWLRFTVVRDPATRLWSAWQSKLLLREPRFVEAFGDAPWFPRVPETPDDLIADFRRFVAAVGRGEAADVHWAVQRDLIAGLPLTHVGRVERLDETVRLLDAPAGTPRENRSPLPLAPHAYDATSAAVLRAHYRADHEAFGYTPEPPPGDPAAWIARAAAVLPHVRATIDHNARLGRLHAVAQRRGRRAEAAEEKLAATAARQVGQTRAPALANREGEEAYAVRWAWADAPPEPGFTGVVRVRDEARTLPFSLPPLLRAVRRVVLIDNGSTDGTPEIARAIADAHGGELEIHHYPFTIARCGAEHLGTPADSVHSLVHFYNWSFSHVRTGYALKWDGDMVLTDDAVRMLRDLAWQLEAGEAIVKVPRYPLYLADERHAFLDTALRNCEPWGWPNRPGHRFAKAIDWELPLWDASTPSLTLPDRGCVELKLLDADEFGHWSETDFAASARTRRKHREWQVFHALRTGAAPPDGVIAVTSPDDRHVVDYVREDWLTRAPAPA